MKNILSLGGGVQSTALLLMSLHGDIEPRFDAAIFADTGWERESTLKTIDRLKKYASAFDVPLITVSKGNIREDMLKPDTFIKIPVYVKRGKGSAMLRRQCTADYKIRPIQKEIRKQTGCNYKNPVNLHLGISMDEIHRMKPSRVKYLIHKFPLIEKRFARWHCTQYLNKHGWGETERSSCIGCPYKGNNDWRQLSDTELKDVTDFENRLQKKGIAYKKTDEDPTPYLHGSLIPIDKISFDTNQENLFSEECEGGCFL